MEMATLFPSSSAQPPQCTPVHKIRRKPAPSLLSPITPITSLSAPDVESTPAAGQVDTRRLSSTKPLITHSRTMSTSLATDPRYPPPDPNDPFAPLSVLRGRSSNAILSASSHFPRTDVTMTDIDATPTPSFMSPKAARTLGVFRGLPTENQKRRFEQSRNRDSMCSFELYADPPHGDSEDENWTVMTPKKPSTGIRSRTPKTSTPVKPSTAGHYTPHSRQRAISSVLSSPSIDYSNNTFTPAPEAFPPPKLSRDRSESSASSTGTGSYSHSGSTSDSANSTLLTPEGSLPTVSLGSGSGSSNGSQIDISDAYAVTRTLLSSSQTHPYAQSEGHAYSPASRVSSSFRYAYGQNRTQINSPENMEGGRAVSPTGSISKLARFFGKGLSRKSSLGSVKLFDGSSSSNDEKAQVVSLKSKASPPSRGRGRTRKLSTSTISISGPVTPPVSIQHASGVPSVLRQVNRPRRQTTSGLPYMSTFSRSSKLTSSTSASSAPVPLASASATGLDKTAYAHANEFGIISDLQAEDEIREDIDISRLKPWAASIPRKRSSLSLSTLPILAVQQDVESVTSSSFECTRETEVSTSSLVLQDTETEANLATHEPSRRKGSRESAVSAGSMGSSYIHVEGSPKTTNSKTRQRKDQGDYLWPRRAPVSPRNKTSGASKSGGPSITGIRFPGFRRAQTSNPAPSQGIAVSSNASESVRGLKISNPMLQIPHQVLEPPSPNPFLTQSSKGHERAMSDSVLERFEQPSESVNTTSLNDLEPCTRLPTSAELGALLSLPLLDETGQIALFGDILNTSDKPDGTTVIVLFIRHFWCPLDQDYVQEVRDLLQRLSNGAGWLLATERGHIPLGNGVGKEELPEVIIVSNGSSTLISKYQEIFDLPGEKGSELKVRMYTDPTCQTYSVLGCIDTGEACVSSSFIASSPPSLHPATDSPTSGEGIGHMPSPRHDTGPPQVGMDHPRKKHSKSRSCAPSSTSLFIPSSDILNQSHSSKSETLKPEPSVRSHSYIKHTSVIGGIATVILRAINHKMPLWEKGGAIKQLGGEFVFKVMNDEQSCGLKVDCMYAHRMQNTHDHTSFGDVLKIALTPSPPNNPTFFRTTSFIHSTDQTTDAPPRERFFPPPSNCFDISRPTAYSAPCSPTMGMSLCQTTQTNAFAASSPSMQSSDAWWTSKEEGRNEAEYIAELDRNPSSWGDRLHILRSKTGSSDDVSESVKGIRTRDSMRSSVSATASSIRAMRAVRVPRGPRMRLQSVSAESLSVNRTRETIQSFRSGMEGIESVLEYGNFISSPDLSNLGQIRGRDWRRRNAMESTSTLDSSVYYDAHDGASVDGLNDTSGEVTVDVFAVDSRSPSRVFSRSRTNSPNSLEARDRTFDSDYSVWSADRTEHLTSICSEVSDDQHGDTKRLRELLMTRASGRRRSD